MIHQTKADAALSQALAVRLEDTLKGFIIDHYPVTNAAIIPALAEFIYLAIVNTDNDQMSEDQFMTLLGIFLTQVEQRREKK